MNGMHLSQTSAKQFEIRQALFSLLGEERVLCDPDELIVYECDGLTLHPQLPDFVVFPATTEEVVGVIEIAKTYQIPFLPRGAGTCLSGGAVASEGGIILELSRLKRILDIDFDNLFHGMLLLCRSLVRQFLSNTHYLA